MSGYRRDRLDIRGVREIADLMGYELTDHLLSRIGAIARWQIAEDQGQHKAPFETDETVN